MTTFYNFVISKYAGEESWYGDFAYDIKRDKNFPKKVKADKKKILRHLKSRNACVKAITVFEELWEEYGSTKKSKYKAVCTNQDHFTEDLFDIPETRIIEANSWKAFMEKIKKAFEDGFEYVYMERK